MDKNCTFVVMAALHSATQGDFYIKLCRVPFLFGTTILPIAAGFTGIPAPATPAVDPQQLIQSQVSKTLPSPHLHFGPTPTRIAVQVRTWLWIDNPGPLTLTTAAGPVSVTATARITSTTWSMGDPAKNPDDTPIAHVPTFTCTGVGQPPTPHHTGTPSCSYTYHWKSTAARTNNTCAWPVTATANWTVTWASTTGGNGTFAMQASTDTHLAVGEWRSSLVFDPNAAQLDQTPTTPC